MSKGFITVELPEAEKRKFARWLRRQSVENRAKVKKLVVSKTETIVRQAAKRAPVDYGFLRRSIRSRYRADFMGGEVDIDRSKIHHKPGSTLAVHVNYAEAVEFGTRPHHIRVRNAKVLAGYRPGKGWSFYGKQVQHPGTAPRPFFYPVARRVFKEFIFELNKMGFR